MQIHQVGVVLLLLMGSLPPIASGQGDEASDHRAIGSYLQSNFPKKGDAKSDLHYEARRLRLQRLKAPSLGKLLPTTRFFIGTLRSIHFEYPEVQVLISVETKKKERQVHHLISPLYASRPSRLYEHFVGLRERDAQKRAILATEISELVLATMPSSRIVPGSSHPLQERRDIHRSNYWRSILTNFAEDGTLKSVLVKRVSED